MAKEGILLVFKKYKETSFSIVHKLRKITKIKKIGHSGTLDPLAEGIMIMLIGKTYTKKSLFFTNLEKEYVAKIHLGKISKTYDKEGPITFFSDKKPSLEEIKNEMKNFQKEVLQIPPMHSAKKINGTRLYKLARKNIFIKREPVKVSIKTKILSYNYPLLELKIICSKGTYIRSIANDVGENLKCGGFLDSLTRTRIGKFKVENCIDQDLLDEKTYKENLKDFF